jgi:hypothetical protein
MFKRLSKTFEENSYTMVDDVVSVPGFIQVEEKKKIRRNMRN